MTRSPMTMSSLSSRLNAAHDVRPIGGDIFTPATIPERSLRGADTLNTPSFSSSAPLAPVKGSFAAESGGDSGPSGGERGTGQVVETNVMMRVTGARYFR